MATNSTATQPKNGEHMKNIHDSLLRVSSELRRVHVDRVRLADKNSKEEVDQQGNSIRVLSPLSFYREYVAKSLPCVILGAMSSWPAMSKWQSDDYLFDREKRHPLVTVALTPNGRADAVTRIRGVRSTEGVLEDERSLFMVPAQRKMQLDDFRELAWKCLLKPPLSLREATPELVDFSKGAIERCIPYIQLQNSNLESEFLHLKDDVLPNVENFGIEAFGTAADAKNIWIGTVHSESTMHQDWYENLYAVVRGTKIFTMIPPWEAPFISKSKYTSAEYVFNDSNCVSVQVCEEEIPWIDEVLAPVSENSLTNASEVCGVCEEEHSTLPQRLSSHTHPFSVEIHEGEVFYLPAMWLHHVAQRSEEEHLNSSSPLPCIVAVNYWFDMSFDSPMFHMCSGLFTCLKKEFEDAIKNRRRVPPGRSNQ